MKILAFVFGILNFLSFGQKKDTWTAFFNKEKTKVGFKDKNGVVKLQPIYAANSCSNKFEDIIILQNHKHSSYYLTKKGRKIGIDSVYTFDNTPDCENEGFIRFKDDKTDKVGLFNGEGKIVIPAEYNNLTRVINGMIVALKGAEKKYEKGGEHYNWIGGQWLLIDTKNNILVEDLRFNDNLDFHSILITAQPHKDSIRQNFKALDGKYYSFIDFEKEFNAWLKTNLLGNLAIENLIEKSISEITWWSSNGWRTERKDVFIKRNHTLLKSKFLQLNLPQTKYSVFNEMLDPMMPHTSNFYTKFCNNCGEWKHWIYPVMTITIDSEDKQGKPHQESFDFLRIDGDYKLISVSLENTK